MILELLQQLPARLLESTVGRRRMWKRWAGCWTQRQTEEDRLAGLEDLLADACLTVTRSSVNSGVSRPASRSWTTRSPGSGQHPPRRLRAPPWESCRLSGTARPGRETGGLADHVTLTASCQCRSVGAALRRQTPSRSTGRSELLLPGPEGFEDLRALAGPGVQVLGLGHHSGEEAVDAAQIIAELLASLLR